MTKLYLDMDGVLADFDSMARRILGATAQEQQQADQQGRWSPERWAQLRHVPNLYRILPKTDIADELVALARRFRDDLGWQIQVLTAIPKNNDLPDAFQDKVEWMQQHYADIRVHFGPYSKDKQHHARPGYYLVDDRTVNCDEWTQAGGRAIKVQAHDRRAALTQLQQVYDQKISFRELTAGLPNRA